MLSEIEKQIIQEELKGIYPTKLKLLKKRNFYKEREVSVSDLGQQFTLSQELDDIEQELVKINDQIKYFEEKLKINHTENIYHTSPSIKDDDPLKDDIFQVREALKQEIQDLSLHSTKEDIARVSNLKSQLYDTLFKDLEEKIAFAASKKELMYSSVLFDTIYTSESLNEVTIHDIQRVREDDKKYHWYDRSLIVTSLTLSIINFKFDYKKANLLLDFLGDSEPGVWERALTGLIIAIIYQKNRGWLRASNFIKRLETLKGNEDVQEGLKMIDFILKNELYKTNLFNPDLYKMQLFSNPMNCFVPFYENNEVFTNAIDNASSDFDVDDFKDYLKKMPLMDSHKYALCFGLSQDGLTKEKLKKDQAKIFFNSLVISDKFSPFQNLISEYYSFFNFFPEKIRDDVFKKQLLLTRTDLKKFVLNKVNQLLLEGNTFYTESSYTEAIGKYNDVLKIDDSNQEAQWQLGNSYLSKKDNKRALDIFTKLEKDSNGKTSNDLLFTLADCYSRLKDYVMSNKYCTRIEEDVKNSDFKLLLLKAENYSELDDHDMAYVYCSQAESKALDSDETFRLGLQYEEINKLEDALRLNKIAVEAEPNNVLYLRSVGSLYCELFDWEQSVNILRKAYSDDKKNYAVKMSLGRVLFLSRTSSEEAKELLLSVINSKSKFSGVAHGNLGHLYFLDDDIESAFAEYIKCINIFNDENDFEKKMNKDLKFIVKLNANTSRYIYMKINVIEHYKKSKKTEQAINL